MEQESYLVDARNAPGSVSVEDIYKEFQANPQKEEFWRAVISGYFWNRQYDRKKSVRIFDGGCGVGSQAYYLGLDASSMGLNTHVTLLDAEPDNLKQAELKMLQLKRASFEIMCGDIRQMFPKGKFDVITYFNLIHFLSPDEIMNLLTKTKEHSNKNALIVISYATPFNNASVADTKGGFIKPDIYATHIRYVYSDVCQTNMTFLRRIDLVAMASSLGLREYAFEPIRNYNFRTTDKLAVYLWSREVTSSENEIIAFRT